MMRSIDCVLLYGDKFTCPACMYSCITHAVGSLSNACPYCGVPSNNGMTLSVVASYIHQTRTSRLAKSNVILQTGSSCISGSR